jgi:hypothetical protein
MSDAFIPVDLDKLLDDFEEQDSSPLGKCEVSFKFIYIIYLHLIIKANVKN